MMLKVGIGDIEDSAARRVPTDSKCIVRIGTSAVDDVVREVHFTERYIAFYESKVTSFMRNIETKKTDIHYTTSNKDTCMRIND